MNRETIFAVATPFAKSAIAVVRISGQGALAALVALTGRSEWPAREMVYCPLINPHSSLVIDQALVVYFKAPHSFTGEDCAELHIHGSIAVIREVLALLPALKLRQAERGEFTRRAVLNGKMDMLEAEGLADLIEAETSEQRTQALRQMHGEMSEFYLLLRSSIIKALAHMEATIDFPDEDIPDDLLAEINGEVREVIETIDNTLARHAQGERIRSGISVVIIGAPNAGKSSLLNALSKKEAAIVSHHAGTTRDLIEIHLDIGGFPVILIDTAGIRQAENEIEAEGIERARRRAAEADIRLILFDSTTPPDAESVKLINEDSIVILTKIDLAAKQLNKEIYPPLMAEISTATNQGVDELLRLIESRISNSFSGEGALITRYRHRELLVQAKGHLQQFFTATAIELKCEELRLAATSIAKITGKIAADDVLDVVFREFCIGK